MRLDLRITQAIKYYTFFKYFNCDMPFSMAKISFHFMKWCNVTLIKSNN